MENASQTTTTTTTTLFPETWNTTSATPNSDLTTIPFGVQFFRFAAALQCVYNPILLCIGTIGNVMTVVIMRRLTSDDATVDIYFTAMAVVDLLYLWTIVLQQAIFFNLNIDILILHGAFCKVFTWLYTGGGTVSCWYLVCMTVHRAMSVVWPHRVNVLCTRRTVLLMMAAVTVCIALLYSHYLVGYEVALLENLNAYKCTMTTQDYVYFHSNIFVYVEMLVYSALPFILIVLANSILTWKLLASAKRNLTEGLSSQAQAREKAANSVTLTVMTVSLTFLVLTLPSPINFLVNHFASFFGPAQLSRSEWLGKLAVAFVCHLLGHTNHAINFYLYCLTGRRFRGEFIKVVCCGRGGSRRLPVLSGKESVSR
ncbi:hypothetical protein ACOMHN_006259 [Nucella lapillus]